MPLYAYKGIDLQGKHLHATQLAPDREALLEDLRRRRVTILQASPVPSKAPFWHTVRPQEILSFFVHLEGQVQCGWSLREALQAFLNITSSLPLRSAIARVIERLEEGASLGEAFSQEASLFGPIAVGLLLAAEATGRVQDTLPALITYLQLLHQAKHQWRRATQQPLMTLLFSLGALLICSHLLVPQIQSLPSASPEASSTLSTYLLAFFGGMNGETMLLELCLGALGAFALWLHPAGRLQLHRIVLNIPFAGDLARCMSTWQFAVALALLLKAQVDLLQALPLAIRAVGNRFMQKQLLTCEKAIQSGKVFSQALQESQAHLSQGFLNAIKVGERTNTLPHVLEVFTTNWHRELQLAIQQFNERLSTAVTSLAGLLLAALLLGLFYPIYDYIGQIGF
ncbi:MAG: type II secretion system F family protein [Holosporales bacterium]|jgi:type II secretory pathway component PulF|nr:type II secretion system F family protein [Holosporales bacterium]